ncbi:hypothetical protein EW026_g7049 [Hermanssonia centrifuga]|uniref:ORC5 lid domain-containing protein n=1 Tax=Hermanssonia centrifuga TaxID=98765 RepID=A0A4S4KAU5_9APHY|nr:hypothetical protein EW026_g7049 [Hermanssonia centrifuga]
MFQRDFEDVPATVLHNKDNTTNCIADDSAMRMMMYEVAHQTLTYHMEGYEEFKYQLNSLISTYPPSFIYIHDPAAPRVTGSVIRSILNDLTRSDEVHLSYAQINAVSCFNPRLLFDTILNALAEWSPSWEEGCSNWSGPAEFQGHRFNESFDAFLHGLRAIRTSIETKRAERLKETMPELLVPLSRLSELSQVDITTILFSDVRWEQIRPSLGAAPDPYFIDIPPLSKQAVLTRLLSLYPPTPSTIVDANTYHPNLKPLYNQFLSTIYSICSPFTADPDELAYIAAARWPGFVKPVLDEYARHRNGRIWEVPESEAEDGSDDIELYEIKAGAPEVMPPAEDTRMRLIKAFRDSFIVALEQLYPRKISALSWSQVNYPPDNFLSKPPNEVDYREWRNSCLLHHF